VINNTGASSADLQIVLPTAGTASISTAGGSLDITSSGQVSFNGSGGPGLNLDGATVNISGKGVTISNGVGLSSDSAFKFSLSGSGLPTFTNNGLILTTKSNATAATILVQSVLGDISLSGTGNFGQGGTTPGSTDFRASGTIRFLHGTSLTVSGNASPINLYAQQYEVSSNTTSAIASLASLTNSP